MEQQTRMTTQSTGWKNAFTAFWDRRAIIMLFLGFSAGIPILLIFSSLSLWLGEAGIDKSAVTFFSWAALGYSFKFVWAPLIDELPVPVLTRSLGRRRAWLLIAQLLIILAIGIMAFSNPALGQSSLIQMAIGAVLLGFASATQDIVIDAYRIELAETQMQTVLASTYNAGYRIGMIVAGAGALFLAAYLGTAKGNYIYEAWKYTYLSMAAVMLVGVITTFIIREPKVERVYKTYARSDYFRLVLVFLVAVAGFVLSYIYSDRLVQAVIEAAQISDTFLKFLLESVRFIGSALVALVLGSLLVKAKVVNQQMAHETWINPIQDFFQRYGLKLALVLLLLIGFYRISDIIAGVISNVFYQDLNFSKEQIAEAVKVYGVIFTLIGGFLGGLLAQRFNIMKIMLIGAILASSTNLIFIGLVKSGNALAPVEIQIGEQHYRTIADEVGYWKLKIPAEQLLQTDHFEVHAAYADQPDQRMNVRLPYLKTESGDSRLALQILPVTSDNRVDTQEAEKSLVIRGQVFGLDTVRSEKIEVWLDGKKFDATVDEAGIWSTAIDGQQLAASDSHQLKAQVINAQGQVLQARTLQYQSGGAKTTGLDVDVQPLGLVKADQTDIELQGKVIKPYSSVWLYFAIIVDNLASGLAGAAFIAFLSSLTSVSFTAVQYAIFSSLMTLTPKILGGYSGTIVTHIGYPSFFLMTTLMGIPILILILWVARLLAKHQQQQV